MKDARKNAHLRRMVLVGGDDGYSVVLAAGEIDRRFEGKSVILAYANGEPPASQTSLRLVVPGDANGGRSVQNVSVIEVR